MIKDFVWRQFLLFCLRNGLFYGETGSSKTDEFLQNAQTLNAVSSRLPADSRRAMNENATDSDDGDDETYHDIIIMSSLERSCRM
jgi:hypothetical protein